MTRKDYELIAMTIRDRLFLQLTEQQRMDVAKGFADTLASTNPCFNRERFIRACTEARR